MSIVLPLKKDKFQQTLTVGPDFASWSQESLAKFAAEAHQKMIDQDQLIEHLKADLKAALMAYRALVREKE